MDDEPEAMGDEADERSENAPEFVLRDGNLRSATWRSEGKFGPLFNTRITKLYRDDEGNPRETSTLGSKDLLRAGELARETHQEVLKRQRERSQGRKPEERGPESQRTMDWHDDDKSRADISRARFKEERTSSNGTRRDKSRDRVAR